MIVKDLRFLGTHFPYWHVQYCNVPLLFRARGEQLVSQNLNMLKEIIMVNSSVSEHFRNEKFEIFLSVIIIPNQQYA